MIHAGIIQINGRRKMAIEEVFGTTDGAQF
jgi:hypothetical protein